jgi:hypothetical protein
MVSDTRRRVPRNTSDAVNRRIRRAIDANVQYYAQHKEDIPGRLRELDREWDIERAIEANAAIVGMLGVLLGTSKRRWLTLPLLVTGFLLQHAIQGWCPPVPVLRRLGFRTAYEIEEERRALKALRGDFDQIARAKRPTAAVAAARA